MPRSGRGDVPLVDPSIAVYNFWCIKRGAERPANLPQLRQGGLPIWKMRLKSN